MIIKKIISFSLIIITLILLAGCQNNKRFNSDIWNEKGVDWQLDDKREKMVSDLIKSDTLIGLDTCEIIKLLGEHDGTPTITNKMRYTVREKYTWNIDPDYIKDLVIEIDSFGIATNCFLDTYK